MPEDEFELYLTLLAKTLRLKDDQRDAIAAELRDHMEQRLRELTLQGVPREDAIETALAEFGDASGLAKDLTQSNPHRNHIRRQLMQTSVGTLLACAAVTFAVMLLTPSNKDGRPNQPRAIATTQDDPVATDDKQTEIPKIDWTRIQIGDLVTVSVHELHMPGVTSRMRLQVDTDGKVRYGRLFEVQVVDRTLRKIEREIADQLRDNQVLRRAAVTVLLSAKPSKPFARDQIVPGEFMEVRVWELLVPQRDSIFAVQIDQDGTISLGQPGIKPIQVEGQSLREIEQRIAQAIAESNMIKDPLVRVIYYVDGRAEAPRLQTGPGAHHQPWRLPAHDNPLSTTRHTGKPVEIDAVERLTELADTIERDLASLKAEIAQLKVDAKPITPQE